MNSNHQMIELVDVSKTLLICRDDFSTNEEFDLVSSLDKTLRGSWLWNKMVTTRSRESDIKEYKQIIKNMAKAGVENCYFYDENKEVGDQIKKIVDRLAEIWNAEKEVKKRRGKK